MRFWRYATGVLTVLCCACVGWMVASPDPVAAQTPASYEPLLSAGELLAAIKYKALQTELKLSREQVQQSKTLVDVVSQKHREFDQARGKFLARSNEQVAGDYEREILGMLTDEQRIRFQQICRQVKAADYLASAEVQQQLPLSSEQTEAVLDAINGPATMSLSDRKKKIEETLNEEQLAKWNELIGPPFKGLRGLVNALTPKKSPAATPPEKPQNKGKPAPR